MFFLLAAGVLIYLAWKNQDTDKKKSGIMTVLAAVSAWIGLL